MKRKRGLHQKMSSEDRKERYAKQVKRLESIRHQRAINHIRQTLDKVEIGLRLR